MSERPRTPDLFEAMKRARELSADRETQARIVATRRTLGHRSVDTFVQRWLDAITPALEKTINTARKALEGIDLSAVQTFIARASEALKRQLPTNLQELEPTLWPSVTRVARDEQLCLAWVPRTEIVRLLLHASSPAERNQLLVEHSEAILADCAAALAVRAERDRADAEALDGELSELDPGMSEVPGALALTQRAVAAAQAGFMEPAQALSTCIIDSVATQYLTEGRKMQSEVKRTINRAEDKKFLAVIVSDTLLAIESSFRMPASWGSAGNQTATSYSRNATVHAARPEAFTAATGLKSVILATSVVLVADHPWVLGLLEFINWEPEESQPTPPATA